VFIAVIFLQAYIDMGAWQVAMIIVEIASLAVIMACLTRNVQRARQQISAHLLVITGQGIDIRTTPIYSKLQLYGALLWVIALAFLAFFAIDTLLTMLDAPSWGYGVGDNLTQLAVLAAVLYLYRPRGVSVDRVMKADDESDGKERAEVPLEDLDEFSVAEARPGLRAWSEGMALPPEPVLVSSSSQMRRGLLAPGSTNTYTAVDHVVE
jgi:hypothetical protein